MKILKGISKVIDTINEKVGVVCSYIAVPLMLLIVFEVLSRKVGHPTIWGYETIVGVYGWLILMTAAYGLLHDSIVKVDILSGLWPEKTKHIVGLITFLVFFMPFITLLLPQVYSNFMVDLLAQTRSWSSWAPLLWPWKIVMPVGFGLLWLQGISEILKHIVWLIENWGKKPENKEEQDVLEEGGAA